MIYSYEEHDSEQLPYGLIQERFRQFLRSRMEKAYMSEEEFLQNTLEKLHTAVTELDEKLHLGNTEIDRIQEYFWENYNEFDEYGYEDAMNRQMLEMEINSTASQKKLRQQYLKMLDSPYFARIDFLYDGEDTPETYYIGIGSFTPKKAYVPLIYDWRAPVSSLFYDFDAGPASFVAPAGTITGEITKKMQYKIQKGKLLYSLESSLKIDDDILKHELSMSADARLKSIVTTIQKEQNQIIRNEKDKILIVQGSAGSGKTSIALHRIAYLLYRRRNHMKANNILILSPNNVFADYISHILPELGEENILETTLDDLAEKELKHIASIETRYEYLERLLSLPEKEAAVVRDMQEQKSDEDFTQALYTFALLLEDELIDIRPFQYGQIKISEEEFRKLFYQKFSSIPLLKRMDAIAEYIVDADDTLSDAGSMRAADDYNMYEDKDSFDYPDDVVSANGASAAQRVSDPAQAKKRLYKMFDTTNILEIYNWFLADNGYEEIDLSRKKLSYEDVYPVIYLKFLLEGIGKYRVMKHLVIDEMQDYTYLQYSILQMMFQCPMTILGDKEQTMEQDASLLLSFLPKIFGHDAKVMTLDKSYRSTTEIAEFAARLAHLDHFSCFTRHGAPIGVHVYENDEDLIHDMLKNMQAQTEAETKAILCKTMQEAVYIRDVIEQNQWIAEEETPLNLLTAESERFGTGITIMPFYLAKGLEFDSVHVAFADDTNFPGDLHSQLLYIMSTRALHTLDFYAVGKIASSITEALAD